MIQNTKYAHILKLYTSKQTHYIQYAKYILLYSNKCLCFQLMLKPQLIKFGSDVLKSNILNIYIQVQEK